MSTLTQRHPHFHKQTHPRTDFCDPAQRHTTPWQDLCDEILVPIGSLVAVFLLAATIVALS